MFGGTFNPIHLGHTALVEHALRELQLDELLLIPTYILSHRVDFLFGSLFAGIADDLWFLWAVLYCSLVVGFCCKLTDKPYLQLLLTILGAFVILLFPQWNLTLFMYPYFVVGFFCGMYRDRAKQLYKIVRYVVLVLFPILVTFYEKKHYIYVTPILSEELGLAASLEIACFRWAIGFVGSIWLLAIMDFLLSLGARIPAVQTCLQKISYLGKNSLQIYCLSVSLLSHYLPLLYQKFIELAGGNLFAQNKFVFDLLFTPILAAVWSVALYAAVVLLKRYRLHKLIFGR